MSARRPMKFSDRAKLRSGHGARRLIVADFEQQLLPRADKDSVRGRVELTMSGQIGWAEYVHTHWNMSPRTAKRLGEELIAAAKKAVAK